MYYRGIATTEPGSESRIKLNKSPSMASSLLLVRDIATTSHHWADSACHSSSTYPEVFLAPSVDSEGIYGAASIQEHLDKSIV